MILGDPKLRKQINDTIERNAGRSSRKRRPPSSGWVAPSLSVNKNMEDIQRLTKPLGEHGETLVGEAGASMHKLNLLSENLLRFSQQAERPATARWAPFARQGALQSRQPPRGKRRRADARPETDHQQCRVFSDKIARHPSVLGVGGAIRKDSGLKDVPTDENGQPVQPQQARRWPLSGGGSWGVGQGR